MKTRSLTASLVAAAALLSGIAEPARAQAPDPCTVFLCMSGISGYGASGPECASAQSTFFSIQIWSPWYNAPATMIVRQAYLMTCPGVMENTPALMAIMSQWGMVP